MSQATPKTKSKVTSFKTLLFDVVVEPDEDVWSAHCPSLPGCVAWGHTQEEAFKNIQEAIDLYISATTNK